MIASPDGKYESRVREKVNLAPIPGRPADQSRSPQETTDFGPFFSQPVVWLSGSEKPHETSELGPNLGRTRIEVFCLGPNKKTP